MNSGNVFFFVAGALAIVAALFVVYPWIAGKPRAVMFSAVPRWVPLACIAAVAVVLAVYLKLGSPQLTSQDSVAELAAAAPAAAATNVAVMGAAFAAAPAQKKAASSMDSAVTGLERRLAAGGGNDADWELLAKSYEFLSRPADAAAARQKHLPAGAGAAPVGTAPAEPAAAIAASPGPGSGVTVRGEVVLSAALKGKIPAGLTLFIVAKSVRSPGAPVAIMRTTTGSWPVTFQLDDSQAMMPGRNLSSAGTVTVEARTSKTGQAMPAPGDFQGVTPQFDPASAKPVRIVIQRVIG